MRIFLTFPPLLKSLKTSGKYRATAGKEHGQNWYILMADITLDAIQETNNE